MQTTRPIRFVLLLCAVAAGTLTGCGLLQPHTDPTRLYVLTTRSSSFPVRATGEAKPLNVGLKPVEIAAYLKGKSMVVRKGSNEVHFADFDRWAEPLDQGISRVIRETLLSARSVVHPTRPFSQLHQTHPPAALTKIMVLHQGVGVE